MIHDRFHSRWIQPASVIQRDQKFVTTVKVRIEKDGRISNVTLARSSGNSVMDDSVLTAAKSVAQIDPLPASITTVPYEININFELTQDQ
jgi:TonB family protein